LNPVALKDIGWKYYIVCDCIIALNIATVYWTYPETKGELNSIIPEDIEANICSGITLEEVSVIFDGKKAVKNDISKHREGDATSLDFTSEGKGEVIVERHEHIQPKV